ncbi:MAG: orotidine-5'-phosphate decarboxylase [Halofilum sp. (in: g-proteobacteria)]
MGQSRADQRRIIVALDCAEVEIAARLVDRLSPSLCRLKVGNELFTRAGPAFIERLHARGFDVFLDLKYHDIPNTVAAACRAAADLGVWMVNVHALGGRRMLEAARTALDAHDRPPLLIGVTVLTSLESRDLGEIGFDTDPGRLASRLADLADDSGCDGVVCSAREAGAMRHEHGPAFRLVTPGIRPAGERTDDQRRTLTPADAITAGADYLVMGRPVTAAPDPLVALRNALDEVNAAADM